MIHAVISVTWSGSIISVRVPVKLMAINFESSGVLHYKANFMRPCLKLTFLGLCQVSSWEFKKLTNVVFSSFDCESIESCAHLVNILMKAYSVACLEKVWNVCWVCCMFRKRLKRRSRFWYQHEFSDAHRVSFRRLSPEIYLLCDWNVLHWLGIGVCLLHGCVLLKSTEQAWSRWIEILFETGKDLTSRHNCKHLHVFHSLCI